MSIGVGAEDPNLLGPGRIHPGGPLVPRLWRGEPALVDREYSTVGAHPANCAGQAAARPYPLTMMDWYEV